MRYFQLFFVILALNNGLLASSEDDLAAAPAVKEEPKAPPAPPAPPKEEKPKAKPKDPVEQVQRLIDDDKERLTDLEDKYKNFLNNPRLTDEDKLQAHIKKAKREMELKIRIAHHNLTLDSLKHPKPPEPKKEEPPAAKPEPTADAKPAAKKK